MVFPVLVMREHSPATFVWVLFWDLTKVYLFENKICDSVMILMCLSFCVKVTVDLLIEGKEREGPMLMLNRK